MKRLLMLTMLVVSFQNVYGIGCSLGDINNYLNNIVTPTSRRNAFKLWKKENHWKIKQFNRNKSITIDPINQQRQILATSPSKQLASSAITQIINNSDYYYELINLDNNAVAAIINKGNNNVRLPLNDAGYRLDPYKNFIAGNVATSVEDQGKAAYQAAGGSIVVDTRALDGQGVSVAQSLGITANAQPRSHAVIVWPATRSFPGGFPFNISIVLDNITVKNKGQLITLPGTFPRIASITRQGITPITSVWQGIDQSTINLIRPAFDRIMGYFNYCVKNSKYGTATQNVTKQNSFDGNQNALPTSGPMAFWWSDIPSS